MPDLDAPGGDHLSKLKGDDLQREILTRVLLLQVRQVSNTKVLKRLDERINGNGKTGLNVRVDRIEQGVSFGKWFLGALTLAILSAHLRLLFMS